MSWGPPFVCACVVRAPRGYKRPLTQPESRICPYNTSNLEAQTLLRKPCTTGSTVSEKIARPTSWTSCPMATPPIDSMGQGVCKGTNAAERLRVPGWPLARHRTARRHAVAPRCLVLAGNDPDVPRGPKLLSIVLI